MIRAVLLVVTLALCGCSRGERELVVSADEGSAPAARALASALRARAQLEPTVAPAAGAEESLRRLRSGQADLAFITADLLADAVNGQGGFRGETVPARSIARLSDAYLQLFVRRDSPIGGLSGLRGRRVSTGPPGSPTELTSLRVLREALLDPERDVTRQALGLADALGALREGRIDAVFWSASVPTPAVTQAAGALPLRLVSTASVVPLLQKRFGRSLYWAGEFPAGVYDTREPAAAVVTGQVLVARGDLPDVIAFSLARAVNQSAASLAAAHPVFRDVGPPHPERPSPAAMHPGASRYFRESRP